MFACLVDDTEGDLASANQRFEELDLEFTAVLPLRARIEPPEARIDNRGERTVAFPLGQFLGLGCAIWGEGVVVKPDGF